MKKDVTIAAIITAVAMFIITGSLVTAVMLVGTRYEKKKEIEPKISVVTVLHEQEEYYMYKDLDVTMGYIKHEDLYFWVDRKTGKRILDDNTNLLKFKQEDIYIAIKKK